MPGATAPAPLLGMVELELVEPVELLPIDPVLEVPEEGVLDVDGDADGLAEGVVVAGGIVDEDDDEDEGVVVAESGAFLQAPRASTALSASTVAAAVLKLVVCISLPFV